MGFNSGFKGLIHGYGTYKKSHTPFASYPLNYQVEREGGDWVTILC